MIYIKKLYTMSNALINPDLVTAELVSYLRTKFNDFIQNIEECDTMTAKKASIIREKILAWETSLAEFTELDLSLKEHIYERDKKTNEIYQLTEFQEHIDSINTDSLIIYIKKAQIFNVYNSDKLNDYMCHESTQYRKHEYGPTYEVVRDSNPQKLVIVITDTIPVDKLQNIKNKIIEFIKKSAEFKNVATDFRIYADDNNTEFVVSSIKFKNLQHKEAFIDDFATFMRSTDDKDIANKIQFRPPKQYGINGARLYKIPALKQLIEGAPLPTNSVEHLISTGTVQSLVINNTYIINSNININKNTVNVNGKVKKTLKTFFKHIYDTTPEWYKEKSYVDIEIIENAYRQYFNDNKINRSMISKQLNGVLYNKSTRSNGTTKKWLNSYTELLKQC